MLEEQWLQLKLTFLLSYNLKIFTKVGDFPFIVTAFFVLNVKYHIIM